VNNELSVLAVGLECGRVSVWVGEGARWTCAVEVSRADAHVAAVRAIAWRPFNDAEDEDEDAGDEEVKAGSASAASSAGGGGAGLGLATVGADHSVRLFRVTLR
jgi:elongator complex protein 2